MSKPIDTRQVEYAYVRDIGLLPNIPFKNEEGQDGFKSRITITFDLKTTDGEPITDRSPPIREHFSDWSPQQLTYLEYAAWRYSVEKNYVDEGKFELSGYQPSQGDD